METIKEEKKADLEQLLNSLIEKGWKPFGHDDFVKFEKVDVYHFLADRGDYYTGNYNIREFVSIDSGLWQFVCENGMIDNLCETRYWRNHFELDEIEYNQPDYQYWIIESALKDESELEDFLLSNINVEGKI